jgi:hypothetical protein
MIFCLLLFCDIQNDTDIEEQQSQRVKLTNMTNAKPASEVDLKAIFSGSVVWFMN